jgi:hypothetical protein
MSLASLHLKSGLVFDQNEKAFGVVTPGKITLINSGSRPIAVLSIEMLSVQPSDKLYRTTCWNGQSERVALTFDQIVVRPYDVAALELRFAGSKSVDDRKYFLVNDVNKELKNLLLRELVICLSFDIVATDTPGWRKTIEIDRSYESPAPSENKFRPNYLIKRNTFWTEVGEDPRSGFLYREVRPVPVPEPNNTQGG